MLKFARRLQNQQFNRNLVLFAVGLTAGLAAIPSGARASLSFCNKTGLAVKVAFAYVVKDAPGTSIGGHRGATVEGWYNFVPGECGKVSEVSAREAAIYIYGVGRGRRWEGASRLCVRDGRFSEQQAFLMGRDGCPRGRQEAGFRGIETSAVNHTVNLE